MPDQEEDKGDRVVTHVTLQQGEPGHDSQPQQVPIVPDGVDGHRIFARPARPDELSDGVRLGSCDRLVVRLEASHVWVAENPDPIRVVPDGRDGNTIFVRRLGPSEQDTGEIVRWVPGEEQVVITTHISHAGFHLTSEVGRTNDLLTSVRLVPDGREGSIVYARSLQPDEIDTGATVQVRPGDNVRIRPQKLVLFLDAIDKAVEPFDDGYKPLTNVIWTWIAIGGSSAPDSMRYLLAASRRLDASHRLLRIVRQGLEDLAKEYMSANQMRVTLYDTIGTIELMLVGFNRALQMAARISDEFGLSRTLPSTVSNKLSAVKALRDAYEHIEDRARGLVRGQPHDDALSVFEYAPLFRQHLLIYGDSKLDIGEEATQLFTDTREYLLAVADDMPRCKRA